AVGAHVVGFFPTFHQPPLNGQPRRPVIGLAEGPFAVILLVKSRRLGPLLDRGEFPSQPAGAFVGVLDVNPQAGIIVLPGGAPAPLLDGRIARAGGANLPTPPPPSLALNDVERGRAPAPLPHHKREPPRHSLTHHVDAVVVVRAGPRVGDDAGIRRHDPV